MASEYKIQDMQSLTFHEAQCRGKVLMHFLCQSAAFLKLVTLDNPESPIFYLLQLLFHVTCAWVLHLIRLMPLNENARTQCTAYVFSVWIWDSFQCSVNKLCNFYTYNTTEPNINFFKKEKWSQGHFITDSVLIICSFLLSSLFGSDHLLSNMNTARVNNLLLFGRE